jgi:hyperosmotically inducible periplasmic protein
VPTTQAFEKWSLARRLGYEQQKQDLGNGTSDGVGNWVGNLVFAQDTPPASTSMHQAGADSGGAVKNTYDGTVTAVDDTRITTEVKTDLATTKDLRSGQIDMTTTAGFLTLNEVVHDSELVARAQTTARNASGVRAVTNDLQMSSSVRLN